MHVGICSSAETDGTAVAGNVKKARRTLYSLMSAGLHGENGLDPETSLHLYQIYVLQVFFVWNGSGAPLTKVHGSTRQV